MVQGIDIDQKMCSSCLATAHTERGVDSDVASLGRSWSTPFIPRQSGDSMAFIAIVPVWAGGDAFLNAG